MSARDPAPAALQRDLEERMRRGDGAIGEVDLYAACAAAALVAHPDASGAEHEMDARRLMGVIVDAYAGVATRSCAPHTPDTDAPFDMARLLAAIRHLMERRHAYWPTTS